MRLPRLAGQIDLSVPLIFLNAITGQRELAVSAATPGLDLWYRREEEEKVSLGSVNDLAAISDPHNDEGLGHISDGEYRLDLPDAAGAIGKRYVQFGGSATDMVVMGGWVDLYTFDPLTINGPQMEAYVTHGQPATPNELQWSIYAMLVNAVKDGTLMTVRQQDGSTAFTLTLNHPTNPTSVTRTS